MEDLLLITAYEIEILSQVPEKLGMDWKEQQEHMNNELGIFGEKVRSWLKCLVEILSIKSLSAFENKLQEKRKTFLVKSNQGNHQMKMHLVVWVQTYKKL